MNNDLFAELSEDHFSDLDTWSVTPPPKAINNQTKKIARPLQFPSPDKYNISSNDEVCTLLTCSDSGFADEGPASSQASSISCVSTLPDMDGEERWTADFTLSNFCSSSDVQLIGFTSFPSSWDVVKPDPMAIQYNPHFAQESPSPSHRTLPLSQQSAFCTCNQAQNMLLTPNQSTKAKEKSVKKQSNRNHHRKLGKEFGKTMIAALQTMNEDEWFNYFKTSLESIESQPNEVQRHVGMTFKLALNRPRNCKRFKYDSLKQAAKSPQDFQTVFKDICFNNVSLSPDPEED